MKNCFLIVNYNDYKSTKHLIDNVCNYSCLEEIVVVDNYSREDQIELLSTMDYKNVTVIYNESNLGYSGAINVAADYLIKKYKKCNIIVSNSDVVILSEEDIMTLIKELNKKSVGLVGPQILERGNILKGRKDVSVNYDILALTPIIKNFVDPRKLYYEIGYYNEDTSLVEVLSTCFFLINSETLKSINFMDENVFLYYEDYILCNKVRKKGLDIVLCNNVKIKHLYSVSVDKNYKTVNKKKMFSESALYYHSTYHDINFIQKKLLKIMASLDILLSKKR